MGKVLDAGWPQCPYLCGPPMRNDDERWALVGGSKTRTCKLCYNAARALRTSTSTSAEKAARDELKNHHQEKYYSLVRACRMGVGSSSAACNHPRAMLKGAASATTSLSDGQSAGLKWLT